MSNIPACKYGANCYQKNPAHLSAYSHPVSSSPSKVRCRHAESCRDLSAKHRSLYLHPQKELTKKRRRSESSEDSDESKESVLPRKVQKTTEHGSIHTASDLNLNSDSDSILSDSESEDAILSEKPSVSVTQSPKPNCKYGANCYQVSKQHLAKYSHPDPTLIETPMNSLESGSDDEQRSSHSSGKTLTEIQKDEPPRWKQHATIYYYNSNENNNTGKIAAFDMDTTLIVPSSGKTHPQGRSDWKWMFPCVPTKLAKLHKKGYKIVIISNQKGISTGKTTAASIQGKIMDLQKDCGVPLCAILSTSDDEYRKPSAKMFRFCVENMISVSVDMSQSFYIGDAAGRPAGWKEGKKKDFGCSDRKFAMNAGLKFQTPEEYFLGEEPVPFEWRGIDPRKIQEHTDKPYSPESLISVSQEMIIFVGFPASGKSTFAKEYLIPNGYIHVNRDTLATQARCQKAAKEALENGKSVVIDNTNPSKKARKPYIDIAKAKKISVRCFHFQTSIELAQHLNNFREILTQGKQKHVPMVGYNMFKKHFEHPQRSEGFTEVKQIEFKRFHPNKIHKKIFQQWTERVR